ncbi:MAG: uroporphyrinogen-III synthase [Candidatus Methylomirabilales bacterium]
MPLDGLKVAITGSRRAEELAHLIVSFGGIPYLAPTVGIEIHEGVDRQVEGLVRQIVGGEIDCAVFMTGPGVYRLMSTAEQLGLGQELVAILNRIVVVARSHKPEKVLERYGIKVSLVPSDNTSEGIAEEMERLELQGKRVAILWYGASHPILRGTLERKGARVFEAMAYEYSLQLGQRGAEVLQAVGFKSIPPDEGKILQLIHNLVEGAIHIITFTSPPSVRNLFRIAEDHSRAKDLRRSLNEHVLVVAIGPPTRRAIEEHGVTVDVMPEVYKLGPMVRALVEYVANCRSKGLRGDERRKGRDT